MVSRLAAFRSEPFGNESEAWADRTRSQVVVTGDFFQLPPVTKSGKTTAFAFESKAWKRCVHRTVTLERVFRQKDESESSVGSRARTSAQNAFAGFVGLLNSLRMGSVNAKMVAMINQLGREIKPSGGIQPTQLFPRREDVEAANHARLDALTGETMTYESRDSGKSESMKSILKTMVAQATVNLKVGAQVMLVKNLDHDLVNGSVGKVLGFYKPSDVDGREGTGISKAGKGAIRDVPNHEDGNTAVEAEGRGEGSSAGSVRTGRTQNSSEMYPLVDFRTPSGQELVLVGMDEFKVEDNDGSVIAKRIQVRATGVQEPWSCENGFQIPLVLAWAISIHKSQGQTIRYMKVDLERVFEKGTADSLVFAIVGWLNILG